AVEDMAEYMKEVFPVESREEVPDGPMTSSYQISKLVEATHPSSPRAIAGTPSQVKAKRVQAQRNAAARRRRALGYVAATTAALALAAAAFVIVPLATRKRAPGSVDEHDDSPRVEVVEPTESSAARPLRTAGRDRPLEPDRPLEAPAPGDVRVISEPA